MGAAKAFANAARSRQTQQCYASDLRHFRANGGRVPATPSLVANYLAASAATLSVATLQRRMWAIQEAHLKRGLPNPIASPRVRDTMRGIRRTLGTAQRQAQALSPDQVAQLAELGASGSLQTLRNRAMILLGFAGAFRRSELVALTVADVDVLTDGIRLRVRRSKTDQEGRGRTVWIAKAARRRACAVESLRRWLIAAQISEGPLFRQISGAGRVGTEALSAQAFNALLKSAAGQLWGQEAAMRISAHSLRAGYCTEAARRGIPLHAIQRQTGHASIETLMRYIRISDDQSAPGLL